MAQLEPQPGGGSPGSAESDAPAGDAVTEDAFRQPQPKHHPLRPAVLQLAADADAALRAFGAGAAVAAAGQLRAQAEVTGSVSTTVVVVGEKKRGKSSLINALLGRPNLLPVDVDVATNVHLVVRWAAREGAAVADESTPQGRPISLAEVAEFAALDPVTGRERRSGVLHVEIGLPDQLLRGGLTLVDTPGVGGLVSGHALVTLAALDRADVLLFVVSGASELTASECRFLAQAMERTATVVFALSQTDKYPAWRDVLARNRTLIEAHAPDLASAPWFAVSSRAKADADRILAAGRAEAAARRLARSGFPELLRELDTELAVRVEQARLGELVQAVGRQIAPFREALERRRGILEGDSTAVDEVRRRQRRLRDLQGQDAAWRQALQGEYMAAEQALRRAFTRDLAALVAAGQELVGGGERNLATALPASMEAGIRGLWMGLENLVRDRVDLTVARLRETLAAADVGTVQVGFGDAVAPAVVPMARTPADTGFGASAESMLQSISIGSAAFGLAAGLTGTVFLPLTAAVGAVAFISRRRRERQERQVLRADAQRYLQTVREQASLEILPVAQDALRTAVGALRDATAARLVALIEEATAELATSVGQVRAEQAQRAQEMAQVRSRLDAFVEVTARSDDLAAALRTPDPERPV